MRRCCARADQVDPGRAEDAVRDQRVLPEVEPTRWRDDVAEWPEEIASTVEIAERCDVEIELGRQLIPRFPTPDGSDERSFLRSLVDAGPACSLQGDPIPGVRAVERAADYELGVIDRMGFNAYFL